MHRIPAGRSRPHAKGSRRLAAWGLRAALLLLLALAAPQAWLAQGAGGTLNVAVAANFLAPMERLGQAFEQQTGVELVASSGSTGTLFAQIQNGAPFDLFFAADVERPLRLEQAGRIVPGSRFTYAIGRLALWSRMETLVNGSGEVLRDGDFRHLAIANPDIAPYGRAARDLLQSLGLWEALQDKIVRGETVAQAFQFVQTGNAELGLVAWSDLKQPGVAPEEVSGSYWLPPQERYALIEQQAVLLLSSQKQALGRRFLDFVRSAVARQRIAAFGYGLPPAPVPEE